MSGRTASAALLAALALGGCSVREDLKKLGEPTAAPAHGTRQSVRIVAGIGTTNRYAPAARVVAGDTLQFRFNAVDGERLSIVIPRGRAKQVDARLEQKGKVVARTPLRAATGKPITVGTATQISPGRIAVLRKPRPDALELELTLPYFNGRPAGEGPVTYKAVVR